MRSAIEKKEKKERNKEKKREKQSSISSRKISNSNDNYHRLYINPVERESDKLYHCCYIELFHFIHHRDTILTKLS